jgi:hypothetical protein
LPAPSFQKKEHFYINFSVSDATGLFYANYCPLKASSSIKLPIISNEQKEWLYSLNEQKE